MGCYLSLTDTQTTEYSDTQLVESMKFKLSHATCRSLGCMGGHDNTWLYNITQLSGLLKSIRICMKPADIVITDSALAMLPQSELPKRCCSTIS